jgi:hypothetical protein
MEVDASRALAAAPSTWSAEECSMRGIVKPIRLSSHAELGWRGTESAMIAHVAAPVGTCRASGARFLTE